MTSSKPGLWQRLRLKLRKRKKAPTSEAQVPAQISDEPREASVLPKGQTLDRLNPTQQTYNAVRNRDLIELKRLLEDEHECAQIDLNRIGPDGRTPLLLAVLNQEYEMVSLLLLHGADTDIRDYRGYSALSLAFYRGWDNIANLIRDVQGDKELAAELDEERVVKPKSSALYVEKKKIAGSEEQLSLRNRALDVGPSTDTDRVTLSRGLQQDGSIITDGRWTKSGPLSDWISSSTQLHSESASNKANLALPGSLASGLPLFRQLHPEIASNAASSALPGSLASGLPPFTQLHPESASNAASSALPGSLASGLPPFTQLHPESVLNAASLALSGLLVSGLPTASRPSFTATTSHPRPEPRRNDRILAQYPGVNEKGAVGWSGGSSFSTSAQFRPHTSGPGYKSLASYPTVRRW